MIETVEKIDNKMENVIESITEFLDDKKAQNPVVLDLRNINSYFNHFIVATGSSQLHCKSMARDLRKFLLEYDFHDNGKPDFSSNWIVLDYSEIVIHLFTLETREFYQLDRLWADGAI